MPIKYYTDTHISKAVAVQLRARGVRCEEVDIAEAEDVEHLEYVTPQLRTLVSHDLDFLNLHAEWSYQGLPHAGIVLFHRHFQGNIGKLVGDLFELYELVAEGAGSVEDVYNTLIEIQE